MHKNDTFLKSAKYAWIRGQNRGQCGCKELRAKAVYPLLFSSGRIQRRQHHGSSVREEITLHKAAKQAFDDLVVKKIPKVKDLNEEYARLLPDKKTAYAEYRKLRDEAQELLIAQSNIGSIYDFAGGKLLRQEKEEQKR